MAPATGKIYIGTSGYQYDHWKKNFYPEDLPKSEWFSFYSRHFSTVEINNTFYNLPSVSTFEDWHRQAPDSFSYALKFSRYGTHMKKLKDPQDSLTNFLSAAAPLQENLGPILVQLPPNWKVNPERLEEFLQAAGNERYTVEFRHSSWLNDDVFTILAENRAALCIHDMLEDHPDLTTTDWVYYRFHGKDYGGSYSYQKLSAVADRLMEHLQEGRDVYVYFNNDQDGHAVANAADLKRYVDRRRG